MGFQQIQGEDLVTEPLHRTPYGDSDYTPTTSLATLPSQPMVTFILMLQEVYVEPSCRGNSFRRLILALFLRKLK